MGKIRNTYKLVVRKPEGKRPLGEPQYRKNNNIKMDLKERVMRMWTGFI
jgi:hypothetical protein